MSIYLIGDGNGRVKIGWAKDVKKRLKTLQAANSEPLVIIRVIEGGRLGEKWLQRYYEDWRIGGEWFQFDNEMLTITPPDEVPAPPRPKRVVPDIADQYYRAGKITLQQWAELRKTAAEDKRRVCDKINADMKAQLSPEMHDTYDRYFKA